MGNFSQILKHGKRMADLKGKGGKWFGCEECGKRRFCFPYDDHQEEIWQLCEECIRVFVDVEVEEEQ